MLQSFRIGFATNSSSTHSVIMHSKWAKDLTQMDTGFSIERYGDEKSIEQDFRLTTPESKLKFLLLANLLRQGQKVSAHKTIEIHTALKGLASRHNIDIDAVIEEISGAHLPRNPAMGVCPPGINISDWFDFFVESPIGVYGYYDNDDLEDVVTDLCGIEMDYHHLRWKQDGSAIVGYDNQTGHKFRWSREAYEKSTTPELVDVKITDFCGYGCDFGYQGSTKSGQHARMEDLEAIFDQLKAMDVFEVAIGGGEPAHHPQFADIIRMADDRNLTFNFTAYGTDWSKNPEVISALKHRWASIFAGSGVGLSVHAAKDLLKRKRAEENLREAKCYGTYITPQTVIGATPMKVTWDLVNRCIENQTPLILLGFKRTGRGKDFRVSGAERADVKKLLEHIKGNLDNGEPIDGSNFHLSVDTAFLDLYGDVLDEMEVPTILRTSPEGKFSMYVDAVEMTAGPSSYCDPSLMEPVGDLKAQFATY